MKPRILVILPTRSRPRKAREAIESWRETNGGLSDLILCLDEDDPAIADYPTDAEVMRSVGPRIRMCPTVNRAVKEFPDYQYYAFIGDDHRFRTKGWDRKAIEVIEKNGGWGIVYGDDLLQREALATACIMSANIIQVLGYMILPGLIHLYADNFWMAVGRGIGRLFYEPSIVIEHCHFTNGKSSVDTLYQEVNASPVYEHDSQVFNDWFASQRDKDIARIKEAMQHE